MGGTGKDLLFAGYLVPNVNPSLNPSHVADSDVDTLSGGTGVEIDTVLGDSGTDILDDVATQINTAFTFTTASYHTLFDKLLGGPP